MVEKGTYSKRMIWNTLVWLFVAIPLAQARYATKEDAATEIQFFNRTIEVEKDGRAHTTIEMSILIRNESGRSNFATQPLTYDDGSQKLKILSAKTIDQGVDYEVGKESIEDRPVASQSQGFSSYHQVLVSFPRVHVGSVLYLKYRLDQVVPDLSENFFTEFVYGREGYWVESRVKVISALPFNVKANDPDGYLDVQKRVEGQTHLLEISLKRPVIRQVIEEEGPLDYKYYPWVTLTTLKDWQSLIQKVSPEYEKVLKEPLPKLLEEISVEAKAEVKLVDQINRVTSLLAEKVRYMGDWRTVSGRLYPQSLDKVARDRTGDCKDFATMTVAILRKLGFKADPALVRRGGFFNDPNDLPTPNVFDHAIVRVELENRPIWVDPTNFASFAHGLFPDIADRWALPLSKTLTDRERIPALDPTKNQVVVRQKIEILNPREVRIKGTFHEVGSVAVGLAGASLRTSAQNLEYHLLSSFDWVDQVKSWKFKPFELSSRIVQDLQFEYEYERMNSEIKTNIGRGYPLQHRFLPGFLVRPENRVADLIVMDQPCVFKRVTLIEKKRIKGGAKLNCQIRSPWVSVSRQVLSKSTGVEVDDTFVFNKALIPNEDIIKPDFLKFQQKMEECLGHVAIMFE